MSLGWGCGGGSFELAETPADLGVPDDVLAEGAVADGEVDAGADSSVDSSAVDSSVVDSSAVDSSAVDSSVVDSSAVDSSAVDSSAVDSSAVDSRAVDSSAVDSAPGDTGVADSAIDSAVVEASTDAGPVCVASGPESCNGRDDDCNGVIDDGVPPPPSCGIGACAVTPLVGCAAGKAAVCTPLTKAATDTTCDGKDDDCNGVVDDGCIVCARYVVAGATGTGTKASPIGTIQAAINSMVATGEKGAVCVAGINGFAGCGPTIYAERVVMSEGISVFGGYENVAFARTVCVTEIVEPTPSGVVSGTGTGVFFGHGLTNATQLDGFTVRGIPSATIATSAITIQSGGTVSNNVIVGGAAPNSFGVLLTSPSLPPSGVYAPRILRNDIAGGSSSGGTTVTWSAGIRAAGNVSPEIRENSSIHGGVASTTSVGVDIAGPARGTLIVDNVLSGTGLAAPNTFGVRLNGDVYGTKVSRNKISLAGASTTSSRGILVNGCTGSGVIEISQNKRIDAGGTGSAALAWGIDVSGCQVVIDSNTTIAGKAEPDGGGVAIQCQGATARCTITNNARIIGLDSVSGVGGRGVNVLGGVVTMRNNASVLGCNGAVQNCQGAYFENLLSGSVVDGNAFDINTAINYSVGINTRWSNLVVANNVVWVDGGAGISLDVRPPTVGGPSETIVHSNTILLPATATSTRESQLLAVDNETSGGSPNGVFRNNVAVCQIGGGARWAFREFGSYAEPRVLENNELYGCATLYGDKETGNLTSILAVNGLMDVPFKGANVSLAPAFSSGFRLSTTSPLLDLGTAAGAPSYDFDGVTRPKRSGYDLGAIEVP